jgi:hypothetical protein
MTDLLFTLRVKCFVHEPMVIIRAYDKPCFGRAWAIDVEVRQGGKVIFPRGQLHCASAVSTSESQDGNAAKELVLSLVAMKLGDTDPDYFADYSLEQLDWAASYGDALNMEREIRYCDENGNLRKGNN